MIYGEVVQKWRLAKGATLRKWPHAAGKQPLAQGKEQFDVQSRNPSDQQVHLNYTIEKPVSTTPA